MMNIPTVPTDNLYKFLALSGLSGAVVLMVTFTIMIKDAAIKSAEITGGVDVLERKVKRAKEEVILLADEVEKLETKKVETKNDEIELKRYLENIDQKKIKLQEQALKYDDLNDELRQKLTTNDMSVSIIKSLRSVFSIFIIVFFIQSALGFILWYHKLQKYQDAILAKEANLTDEKQ
jgi:FtsZ-binding cell division protein ZapB